MHQVIRTLRKRVPNIDKAVISVHCHNDLGMAVANSLAAVEAGAGQVECTINGLGERAGNCSLEEVVMALRTRNDFYHADTGVNTRRLVPDQPAGGQHHRHPGAAQQGDRRPERLRPRGRHPPGRHAQGAHDLRDHAARGRGLRHHRPGAGQAQRPGRPGQPRQGPGLLPRRRAAPDGLRAVQGPGRQEEGDLRRRHRRPDRAGDPLGARTLVVALLRRHFSGTGKMPAVHLRLRRGGEDSAPTWPAATGRWTRSSWRSRS